MAKKIHQFTGITAGINIIAEYFPVIKLGIQAPAGTQFILNGGSSAITVGNYGIYELDLTNLGGLINSIVFKENDEINQVIVDIVYEGGDS